MSTPLLAGVSGLGSSEARSDQGMGRLCSWPLIAQSSECNYPQPPRGGCAHLHSLPISDLWGLGTLAGAQASGLRKQVEPAGVSCLGGSELIIVLSPKALGKFGERIQFAAPHPHPASYCLGFAKPHQAFALADWPQDPVQFATTGLASWGRLRAGEMH